MDGKHQSKHVKEQKMTTETKNTTANAKPKRTTRRTAKAAPAAEAVREQVERGVEKVKAAVGGLNERLGDLRGLGGDAVATAKASGKAVVEGIGEFDREVLAYARGSLSEAGEATRAVFAAKSLGEVADIHARYVVGRIEGTASCVKILADISARSGVAVFEPWARTLGELAGRGDKARAA